MITSYTVNFTPSAKIMKRNEIRADAATSSQASATPRLRLQLQFSIDRPNPLVTDVTYIRNYEGLLYLAVVLDLYSRRIIGWSMKVTLA